MNEKTKAFLKDFAIMIAIPALLILLVCTYNDSTDYSSADVDYFIEQAHEEGYNEGYERGYEDGADHERSFAFDDGYNNGYEDGYNDGCNDRISE